MQCVSNFIYKRDNRFLRNIIYSALGCTIFNHDFSEENTSFPRNRIDLAKFNGGLFKPKKHTFVEKDYSTIS